MNLELFDAVTKNDKTKIKNLLDKGASLSWKYDKYGDKTAVDKAIEMQNSDMIEYLLNTCNELKSKDNFSFLTKIVSKQVLPLSQKNPKKRVENNDEEKNNTYTPVQKIERAIQEIKKGNFVIVVDDENRENEGDLIIASEKVTPEKIAFLVNNSSGLICCSITNERCKELDLQQMVQRNTESHQTAFTVSVDYKFGTTTGISASDRAATIRALADKNTKPTDFCKPGHIFPLRAKKGGVLEREGHTEAAVDLARLAGLYPSGTICEITKKDGSMARLSDLRIMAKKWGMHLISIEDLKTYRKTKKV